MARLVTTSKKPHIGIIRLEDEVDKEVVTLLALHTQIGIQLEYQQARGLIITINNLPDAYIPEGSYYQKVPAFPLHLVSWEKAVTFIGWNGDPPEATTK